ncbi:MAG: hypothetical protein LBG52_00840 [Candidatus Peribacteria bacterium]|jgi:hypothetical protein|nr:hypothetical protein [Candidatus Peribacteria bacterium]
MTTNKLHITWDKENLEALKDHVIKGFQKNIETLNRATFTDTEKVPSLTKTAQTWTDAAGISQPSAQSYDATQTKVSFARGYVTPFIAESKKPPQQQIDLVLMPNADASQISPLDNYGGAAATVAVKGLDGKKIKSTITVKTDDEGSKLEIKGEKS